MYDILKNYKYYLGKDITLFVKDDKRLLAEIVQGNSTITIYLNIPVRRGAFTVCRSKDVRTDEICSLKLSIIHKVKNSIIHYKNKCHKCLLLPNNQTYKLTSSFNKFEENWLKSFIRKVG